MPITAAFDSIKEKAGGNCVLEERAESGCCVEFKRGALDEDGIAEFPEQSRESRKAYRRHQRTDSPNHEVNMLDAERTAASADMQLQIPICIYIEKYVQIIRMSPCFSAYNIL